MRSTDLTVVSSVVGPGYSALTLATPSRRHWVVATRSHRGPAGYARGPWTFRVFAADYPGTANGGFVRAESYVARYCAEGRRQSRHQERVRALRDGCALL